MLHSTQILVWGMHHSVGLVFDCEQTEDHQQLSKCLVVKFSFLDQNSHQPGFVAHHIHLCFQARMSDESLLAPHPRLQVIK